MNKKSWLILLLDKFLKRKYIKQYDYRLFDELNNSCLLVSQNKINKIENKINNSKLSVVEIEKYVWDIKKKIIDNKKISFCIFFDLKINQKPFADYKEEHKAKLKLIFYSIINTI